MNETKEQVEDPQGEQMPAWLQLILCVIALGLAVWFGLDAFWL